MKYIKLGLVMVSFAALTACGNNESEETNTTDSVTTVQPADNTDAGMTGTPATSTVPDDAATGNGSGTSGNTDAGTSNINNTGSRGTGSGGGVKTTGQYNSDQGTPPPPNTDRQGKNPAHTYGDTAGRRDGANSVR